MRSLTHAAAAAAMLLASAAPAAAKDDKGSLYLQCDGQPNNMTGMESFARLVALSFVVGLLAPPPESPDPEKRLFGEDGVRACSQLLDGASAEGNGLRRVPLILARALHKMEVENWDAAIADIGLAREEAAKVGISGNPYFERSMGLSFDNLEGYAWLFKGDYANAREVGLHPRERLPYSFYAAVVAHPFPTFNEQPDDAELAYYDGAQRILAAETHGHAERLEGAGRFAEAAEIRDALVMIGDAWDQDFRSISDLAKAAVTHRLAGDEAGAETYAARARELMDKRRSAGIAIPDRSETVEVLDLYDIVGLARSGSAAEARTRYAARSEWTEAPQGMLKAVRVLLREGADPATLTGQLAKSEDEIVKAKREEIIAGLLAALKNNRTFYNYILPYAKIGDFERLSKDVWKTDKSRLLGKEKAEKTEFYSISINSDAMTQPDAMLLHAALVAKARGYKGFIYLGNPKTPWSSWVRFANPGDEGIPMPYYLDADAVIAELKEVIPSPEALKARRNAQMKKT